MPQMGRKTLQKRVGAGHHGGEIGAVWIFFPTENRK